MTSDDKVKIVKIEENQGCFRCAKYTIFGANLVIALFGFALLVLALWVRIDFRFRQFLSEQYYEVTNGQNLNVQTLYVSAYIVLVIGCFLVTTACSGCCGAIRESICCLATYALFLITTALLQIAVAVFIFIEREHIDDELQTAFNYMVQRYYIGPDILTFAMDALQDGFDCCGNSGCGDYRELRMPLPRSCDLSCDGCRVVVSRVLRDSFATIAVIGLFAVLAEFLAVIVAFCLLCKIRKEPKMAVYSGQIVPISDAEETEGAQKALMDESQLRQHAQTYGQPLQQPQFTVLTAVPPQFSSSNVQPGVQLIPYQSQQQQGPILLQSQPPMFTQCQQMPLQQQTFHAAPPVYSAQQPQVVYQPQFKPPQYVTLVEKKHV